MTTTNVELAKLIDVGNVVPEGYRYSQKMTAPEAPLHLPHAYFKWYNLYPLDAPITPEQEAETRAFVAGEAERLQLTQDLGFVILHRAGSVLLLLLISWRNTNELWESVYVHRLEPGGSYELVEFPSTHRATYCVWELGPIWHERNAWMRFLSSERDEVARQDYVSDLFSGMV